MKRVLVIEIGVPLDQKRGGAGPSVLSGEDERRSSRAVGRIDVEPAIKQGGDQFGRRRRRGSDE